MRRILLNILLRIFFREQREIKSISIGEQLSLYEFCKEKDVVEILKYNRTCMTLWHFETKNKEEANLVKGMALMINILLDAHERSLKLKDIKEDDKRLSLWKKYKDGEKLNIMDMLKKVN